MPGFGTWTWSLRLLSVRAQRVRGARRRVISWCLSQSTGAGVHKNFVCASFWAARERGGRLGRRGATPMHGVGRLRGGPARLTNYKKRSSLRAAQGGSTTYEGRRIPPYCVRLYGVFSTRQLSQNVDKSENRFSRRRHIPSPASAPRPMPCAKRPAADATSTIIHVRIARYRSCDVRARQPPPATDGGARSRAREFCSISSCTGNQWPCKFRSGARGTQWHRARARIVRL